MNIPNEVEKVKADEARIVDAAKADEASVVAYVKKHAIAIGTGVACLILVIVVALHK